MFTSFICFVYRLFILSILKHIFSILIHKKLAISHTNNAEDLRIISSKMFSIIKTCTFKNLPVLTLFFVAKETTVRCFSLVNCAGLKVGRLEDAARIRKNIYKWTCELKNKTETIYLYK